MLELADRLLARLDGDDTHPGGPLVVATVVGIDGSSPRMLGTSMAWDGEAVIGSIAGGCVEGATVEVAERVLDDGRTRTVEFGVSDETALGVGLSCGGLLRIHLALLRPDDAAVAALRLAASGRSAGVSMTPDGFDAADCAVEGSFVDFRMPPARLIVIGAMEYSTALSNAAQVLGYRVTVCDPRELFTTAARFPGAELVVEWPPDYLARTAIDESTVICLLSHDDRFDADALALALRSPAAYVGAMGSRRTHARRVAALRQRGVGERLLDRLHSPIGLDLGGSTPEETALSILAEVLAERTGASRRPLQTTQGAIHSRDPQPVLHAQPTQPALHDVG
ncbi:XdhC family protein [Lysinimonas soli]|uniref:XdhC family protein n=1 Tax=Lysinimonas soli TaxID=1074233 RepID=A0ABW0NVF3_9MICO